DGVVSDLTHRARRLSARLFFLQPAKTQVFLAGGTPETGSSIRVPPQRLTVEGVTVRYGQVVAVDSLDLHVDPGEVVALIGPNGAGKTSLMDAVTGLAPCSGKVTLGSTDLSSLSLQRRTGAGIVRTFQALELFEDMTVFENLQVAAEEFAGRSLLVDLVKPGVSALPAEALEAVRQFNLADYLDRTPRELTLGRRRLVAVARAVAMKPSVLLLDEPAAGLDSDESAEFAKLMRRLATDWGMGVLVVEHDMDFVMDHSDRVVVMDFGAKIAQGTPTEVRNNPVAIAAYLGEPVHEAETQIETQIQAPVGEGVER
ncbi:MAG: ABC transporter ATP-binding protein, partial [Actinomycetes bacterium]